MRGELPECFCEWQAPDVLYAKADEARRAMGEDRFLDENATKHLREAWVIGRIGTLLDAARARLSPTDPPDGYLDLNVGIIPVEVTERLQEGRRRGDEDHSALRHLDQDELDAAIEHNKVWMEALIRKKLAKDARYPPNTVLLVYHNTSLFNWDPRKIRGELEAASQLRGTNIVGSIILFAEKLYGRGSLARIVHPATKP